MKLIKKNTKNKSNVNNEKARNVISNDSKFAIVEGYKIARTNLMFSLTANQSNCAAVTSWSKGEGKSTATVNLAISLAKMGKRILLIDTDLRRPNLHNLLKLKNESGLSDVIGQFGDFDQAVHRDVISCLDVLTSGAIPPNPSELLGSSIFEELITRVKQEYDYVIMDTPPLGVVADTLLLKNYVAGYVFVVRERVTSHGDIENALQNIKIADTKIIGFLKVGCDLKAKKGYKKRGYKYGYGYGYGYGYYGY